MGRVIWIGALLALAAVVIFAQLDRASRFQPHLAPLVPRAFSGFAAEQRSREAIAAGYGETAVREASRLIARRPLPAEHLALLSLAATQNGDQALALAAMEASATRGWRVPVAQLASARAALSAERYDLAAQRIAALLSTGSLPDETHALLAELITSAEGRAAMAERYAAEGHWQANSLTVALPSADPRDVAWLLAEALDAGATLPCDRLAILAASASSEDRALFWPRDCPAD
ncbi:hypothetical protein [Aurantiacibacter sp. MUD61]|uniref:hypothetical protein n=1 Tax=Aurantiacibacter sp. MUD61 TaxID=3009083 RepID=UPI0022F0EE8F|nr:hypothetical protein [Aurantiacibacter sp. MUD61]